MSQSPINAQKSDARERYLINWNKLGERVARGASFSGRERNCCFLNTGNRRFADVSTAVGLDLIDDGRGMALVDWDRDGDVDVWLSNRTAPAVRMMRNELATGNHFVAFRLRGTTCNRDAIGARLELQLKDPNRPVLIQTLRAGDAFASQSSKWMHFGLGQDSRIAKVVVRWPGQSTAEAFDGLIADQRYLLVQGKGVAERLETRRPIPLVPTKLVPPPATNQAHVLLTQRRKLPELLYQDLEGQQRDLRRGEGDCLLINLWASWCAPCVAELSDLAGRETELRDAGLSIVALCTDQLTEKAQTDLAAVRELVEEIKWPFDVGLASANIGAKLTELDNGVFYRKSPLPLPCSFLIDSAGQVGAIYRGAVSVEQLIADVPLMAASRSQLYQAASPLGGRNAVSLFNLNPLSVARAYYEGGYLHDAKTEAENYIRSTLSARPESVAVGASGQSPVSREQTRDELLRSAAAGPQRQTKWLVRAYQLLAAIHLQLNDHELVTQARKAICDLLPDSSTARTELALALIRQGKRDVANEHLIKAGRLSSDDPAALTKVAQVYLAQGNLKAGTELLASALRLAPKDIQIRLNLAIARQLQGNSAEAILHYREILQLQPTAREAANNLAWILATHRNAEFRNWREALELASHLCESTGFDDPSYLDTLAAAQASAGDFTAALKTASQAIDLSKKRDQQELADRLHQRMDLFRLGQPYRE